MSISEKLHIDILVTLAEVQSSQTGSRGDEVEIEFIAGIASESCQASLDTESIHCTRLRNDNRPRAKSILGSASGRSFFTIC